MKNFYCNLFLQKLNVYTYKSEVLIRLRKIAAAINLFLFFTFFNCDLGFTPCKAEQPLQGIELQEKEAQKE